MPTSGNPVPANSRLARPSTRNPDISSSKLWARRTTRIIDLAPILRAGPRYISDIDMAADSTNPLYAQSTYLTKVCGTGRGHVMFAAIRFRISAMPVVTMGIVENSMRSYCRLCLTVVGLLVAFACQFATAQSNQEWLAYKRACRINMALDYASWVRQGSHCPARETGPSNNNNGVADANAAAEAEAAAEAKRRRDAELEQQRIEAENQRLAEAAEKQAQFDQDKREALGQLKGAVNGGDFDSGSGLKGLGSVDSGLKDTSDSSGLKTMNTDTSVVDLSDTNLADANKALMRHQWAMSIDQRYKDDPEVQQYIRDLFNPTASGHDDMNMNHVRSILTDQLRVSGMTPQKIDSMFAALDTFFSGHGSMPQTWGKASTLAHEIDTTATTERPQRPYYDEMELASTLGKTENIKATAVYMGTGPQTMEDCVLHAISNGAQVPFPQVRAELAPTLKNLAIAKIEVRNTPDLEITAKNKGGTGGLNAFEEILIANKVGNVIGVPEKSFAEAIESTHHPVITSVVIDKKVNGKLVNTGSHEVAVTGVYRAANGKVYYSVMDSNLNHNPNYTAYVEKNDFEDHMAFGGGFVVVPAEKH